MQILEKHNESQKKRAFKKLVEIETTELFLAKKYCEQYFRCPVHLALGHEASAAAILSVFESRRKVFSYHRSHHHFLASGATPDQLLFELAGLESGPCLGFGGSHHLRSKENDYIGSTPIITGTLPVAMGMAYANKIDQNDETIICFCGDSSAEEGLFYECLNMMSLYNLKVCLVIEDNSLACYTEVNKRQGFKKLSKIIEAFNIKCFEANAYTLDQAYKTACEAHNYVEQKHEGVIVINKVERSYEHCGPEIDNELGYRESPSKQTTVEKTIEDYIEVEDLNPLADEVRAKTLKTCEEAYQVIVKYNDRKKIY